jgi:PAS domain-containing protein
VDGHLKVFIHVGFFCGCSRESGRTIVPNDRAGHQQCEDALKAALRYAESIIATLREPFVVLNHDLRVKTANRSFFESFHVSKEETENRLVYDLGNGQWDIPRLRTLLNEVLSNDRPVQGFEMEHNFPDIGQRTMLLHARKFSPEPSTAPLIMLAIEDVSERRRHEETFQGLLESAPDATVDRQCAREDRPGEHPNGETFRLRAGGTARPAGRNAGTGAEAYRSCATG